jgi:hypothetical protein
VFTLLLCLLQQLFRNQQQQQPTPQQIQLLQQQQQYLATQSQQQLGKLIAFTQLQVAYNICTDCLDVPLSVLNCKGLKMLATL